MTWLDQVKARLKAATRGPYTLTRYHNGPVGLDDDGEFQICEFNRNMPNWENDQALYMNSSADLDKAIRIIEVHEKALLQARRALIVAFGDSGDDYYAHVGEALKLAHDKAEAIKGEK